MGPPSKMTRRHTGGGPEPLGSGPQCDFVGCTNTPLYDCMCRRCDSEPEGGKFWSCTLHVNSPELLAKHRRIYPNHEMRLVVTGSTGIKVSAPEPEPADRLSRSDVAQLISAECDAVKEMLLKKNESYGNSFAEPIGIFAKGLSVDAQIRVRIDDKLSRLAKGGEFAGDDTALDLIGYLVLFRVVQKMKGGTEK